MLNLPSLVVPGVSVRLPAPLEIEAGSAHADLYLPERMGAIPAVVLWHGEAPDAATDWAILEQVHRSAPLVGWSGLLGARGIAAASVAHRTSTGWRDPGAAADDLDVILAALGDVPEIDASRVGVLAFSGGIPVAYRAAALGRLAAIVTAYGPLDLRDPTYTSLYPGLTDEVIQGWSPCELVHQGMPAHLHLEPLRDWMPNGTENFVRAAARAGARVRIEQHPTGVHGFDFLDDDERTTEMIGATLDFLSEELGA